MHRTSLRASRRDAVRTVDRRHQSQPARGHLEGPPGCRASHAGPRCLDALSRPARRGRLLSGRSFPEHRMTALRPQCRPPPRRRNRARCLNAKAWTRPSCVKTPVRCSSWAKGRSGHVWGSSRGREGSGLAVSRAAEDWVDEDHPVRGIDLFVEDLDLPALGFDRTAAARRGGPGIIPPSS